MSSTKFLSSGEWRVGVLLKGHLFPFMAEPFKSVNDDDDDDDDDNLRRSRFFHFVSFSIRVDVEREKNMNDQYSIIKTGRS